VVVEEDKTKLEVVELVDIELLVMVQVHYKEIHYLLQQAHIQLQLVAVELHHRMQMELQE
tara:strand:+ start:59 stop:238 length:180 start_codon:yes stop_codon:yes gene_type:complete